MQNQNCNKRHAFRFSFTSIGDSNRLRNIPVCLRQNQWSINRLRIRNKRYAWNHSIFPLTSRFCLTSALPIIHRQIHWSIKKLWWLAIAYCRCQGVSHVETAAPCWYWLGKLHKKGLLYRVYGEEATIWIFRQIWLRW